jgi:hypothetical protein
MKEVFCKLCPDKSCYKMWPEGRMIVVGEEKHPSFTIFSSQEIEDCGERIIYQSLDDKRNTTNK